MEDTFKFLSCLTRDFLFLCQIMAQHGNLQQIPEQCNWTFLPLQLQPIHFPKSNCPLSDNLLEQQEWEGSRYSKVILKGEIRSNILDPSQTLLLPGSSLINGERKQ